MIDLEKTIREIEEIINTNNKFIKAGGSSNSLEKKYFFISTDMENFIIEFITHKKDEFISMIRDKPSLLIVDAFAGSGNFTLMFAKHLLKLLNDNASNINIQELKIFLNDKMGSL